MSAKDFLESIKVQDRKVNLMRTKLTMLREALNVKGVSYETTDAKLSSHPTDKMAEAICKLVDYENEVKEEEAKLTILRFNAEKAIQSLADENEREALERFYLLFQDVDEIKEAMTYSRSRVYDFIRRGLSNLKISETSD